DHIVHRVTHVLDDRRQDQVGVLRCGLYPVGVHTDDPHATRVTRGSGGTKANRSGHGQNDVRTLVDEADSQVLAVGLVVEVAGAGAVRAVPTKHGQIGTGLFVVVQHAVTEAVHEHGHRRDVDTTEGGNHTGLGGGSCS